MDYVSGDIVTVDGFEKGYFGFENQVIVERGHGNPPEKPICRGLVVPLLVNAHTHIGDSFIRKRNLKLPRNVEKLVGPPDGLKHRLLRETPERDIIQGIKTSVEEMKQGGVSFFCDFRENGIKGVNLLLKALEDSTVSFMILSRPDQLKYDREEMELLLDNSQGVGLSSIADWEYSEVEKVARHVKRKRKIFALHASEETREDIDLVLDLNPDFLVHLVKATASDLTRVKENNVPVVVCPRSNAFFGLKPNLDLMKEIGVEMVFGTDNAMLNTPSILEEIQHVRTISHKFSTFELLYMGTYGPRKALNLDGRIHGLNFQDGFIVLDKNSLKPLYISTIPCEG